MVTAIGKYYNELNSYERKLYFQGLALDPAQRLAITNSEGQPTPFLGEPFSVTAIQARLTLLRQLGTYAERLTSLAGNDAPERFRTNAASLANSLTALQGTFTSLNLTTGNGDAKRYVGPLGTIAGIVGNLVVARKRKEAVRQAILDGEPPINELLSFLEQDLEKYVSTTRLTGAEQQLSDLGRLYNTEKSAVSYEQRQRRLDELSKLAEEYKLMQNVRPSAVVRQMRMTHQTLVQAVKTNDPFSVGLVLGVVEEYEAMAGNLLAAIHDLNELKQPKK